MKDNSGRPGGLPMNGAQEVSAVPVGIPDAWGVDAFLEESRLKEIKFSEVNPTMWRELLAAANPPTLTVCKHLEGEAEDQACRCGYPGSVWADPEHVLFTMGDVWGSEPSLQAPRIARPVEIASAQLLACLYNNAEWLIGLAAQAIEAGTAETHSGSVHESAVLAEDAPKLSGPNKGVQ
jgi:hypothetical protein